MTGNAPARHTPGLLCFRYAWSRTDRLAAPGIDSRVPEYRVYELSHGNQIAGMRVVVSDSDRDAIEKAKALLDSHDIEIWQGARVVTRLRHSDSS